MSMGIQHAYDRNHWSSVVWAFAFGPFAMYHTRHGIFLMGRTRESWSVPLLARRLVGEIRRHSNHFVSSSSCDYDSVLQDVGLRDLYDNARRSWPNTVTTLKGHAMPPAGPTKGPQYGCFLLHYGLRRLLKLFVPRCSVILFLSSLVFALQCSVHNTSGHEVKMPVIRIKLHIQRYFCCKIANEVSRSDPQEPWQQVKMFVRRFLIVRDEPYSFLQPDEGLGDITGIVFQCKKSRPGGMQSCNCLLRWSPAVTLLPSASAQSHTCLLRTICHESLDCLLLAYCIHAQNSAVEATEQSSASCSCHR